MAAERGHVVGTLLSLSAAGPMCGVHRKRAQELRWTAGPDRFAYAAVIGVGMTREEGLRRANTGAGGGSADQGARQPVRYRSIASCPCILLASATVRIGSRLYPSARADG